VSDRQIRAAVKGGATCVADLSRAFGLGTCCGKCVPEARAAMLASRAEPQRGVQFADSTVCAPA
jgi:bacterioferritin-associated ferredoxin